MDKTTIQIEQNTRDLIKKAAKRRAVKLGVTKLSMNDYLRMVSSEETRI